MAPGDDRRLHVLALDRRGASADDGGQSVAPWRELAPHVLDALGPVATTSASLGVSLDAELGAELIADAAARGLTVLVPAESPDETGFTLVHGDAFGRRIEELAPDVTSVRVRWNPSDDPDDKKAQLLGLTKLGAWLHETDRTLLLELVVRPSDDDLAEVGGDHARFAAERRAALARDAVSEIRGLGVEPDLWAVEGSADPADAQAFGELVRDAGRDHVRALVLLRDGDRAAAEAALRASAPVPAFAGFVLAVEAWAGDVADRSDRPEDAAAAITAHLTDLIDVDTAAASA